MIIYATDQFNALFRILFLLPVLFALSFYLPSGQNHAYAAGSGLPESTSPYSGQEGRAIKALSLKNRQDLQQGKGMGFAKTAELNRYPGPRHVLDLADPMALTPAQRVETENLFSRMQARAKALGLEIISAEQQLDRLFAVRTIDDSKLASLTKLIGILQGKLRAVHLSAHLRMTDLLTEGQIAQYQHLRGYESQEEGSSMEMKSSKTVEPSNNKKEGPHAHTGSH